MIDPRHKKIRRRKLKVNKLWLLCITSDLIVNNIYSLVSEIFLPLPLMKWIKREKAVVANELSFGSLQPSFIHAYFFMLWKCCICQTIRRSVPSRPLYSEIPCCFDASIDLRPIRHKERWSDYWCNISEFIAGWCASGHRRKVRHSVWAELSRTTSSL